MLADEHYPYRDKLGSGARKLPDRRGLFSFIRLLSSNASAPNRALFCFPRERAMMAAVNAIINQYKAVYKALYNRQATAWPRANRIYVQAPRSLDGFYEPERVEREIQRLYNRLLEKQRNSEGAYTCPRCENITGDFDFGLDCCSTCASYQEHQEALERLEQAQADTEEGGFYCPRCNKVVEGIFYHTLDCCQGCALKGVPSFDDRLDT